MYERLEHYALLAWSALLGAAVWIWRLSKRNAELEHRLTRLEQWQASMENDARRHLEQITTLQCKLAVAEESRKGIGRSLDALREEIRKKKE